MPGGVPVTHIDDASYPLFSGTAKTTKFYYGSSAFDASAWSKQNCSISADATTDPDDGTSADGMIEDNTPAISHYMLKNFVASTFANNISVPFSVYIKPFGRSWVRLAIRNKANNYPRAHFDCTNGVIGVTGETGYQSSSIEAADNGFYKCSIIADIGSGVQDPVSFYIYLCEDDNDYQYDGDGSSGVYLWKAEIGIPILRDPGAGFLSAGVDPDLSLVIKNTTDGSSGTITAATEDEVTAILSGGTNNYWTSGDEYVILKTDTEDSVISTIYTDKRFGRKVTDKNELQGGLFPEDIDIDEHKEKVFGPGQPWKLHE